MAGVNLRKIRKAKGLTQLRLQVETGIEQSLLSKYENGERVIPTETLELLSDYFKTNTDYLLDRTDTSKPYDAQKLNK